MIPGPYDHDKALQAQCMDQLARHDDVLRERLFAALVAPNMRILRGGNGVNWNEAGWYSATEPAGLQAAPVPQDAFPVPDGGGAWHTVEHDRRHGAAFRFFTRRAWLALPVPAAASTLSFVVPHVVMPEALAGLTLRVSGVPVTHLARPFPDACAKVSIGLDAAMVTRACQAGHLTLELATPVEAMPALIYPGSSDYRHLSLAICFPYFEEGACDARSGP